jgi:hypothetical protein
MHRDHPSRMLTVRQARVREEPTMYPTNEVRLAAIIEGHHERARHRRAINAALAAGPARIGRRITQPSEAGSVPRPARPAAQSS